MRICNFIKTNTPPWLFYTLLKLYKCYQIGFTLSKIQHSLNNYQLVRDIKTLKVIIIKRFLSNSSSIPQIPSKIHIQKQDGEDEVISILNSISENELNLVLKSVMDTINLFDVIQRKVFYYKLLRFFKKETLVCSQNIDLLICLPKLICNKFAPFKLRQATDSVSNIFS